MPTDGWGALLLVFLIAAIAGGAEMRDRLRGQVPAKMERLMTADYRCPECLHPQSHHTPDYDKPAGSREWRGCPEPTKRERAAALLTDAEIDGILDAHESED